MLTKNNEIRQMGLAWLAARPALKSLVLRENGDINVNAILVMAVLASVTFIVLANLWSPMSTANATIQAATATDTGTVVSKTIFGLLLWIIPLGIGLALLIRVLRKN
jgi:hypothetical protein